MKTKIKFLIFITLLLLYFVTMFTGKDFHGVKDFDRRVLEDPIQTEVQDDSPVKFSRDGYDYEISPLYDYEINGLVVHKMDYRFFSLEKADSTFPYDLCVLWGKNIESGAYQDKSLSFSQDSRFCMAKWSQEIGFSLRDVSNNHLLVNDTETEKKLKSISSGDQVKITGQLIKVKAYNTEKNDTENAQSFDWVSSITRDDTGDGACEVILVKDVEILQKANVTARTLHTFSFYGLISFVAFSIALFFYSVIQRKNQGDSL